MDDTNPTQPAADAPATPAPQEPANFSREYVHELREEAKANRLQAAQFKKQLDEMAASQEADKAKALEEQGEYKKLFEESQEKLKSIPALETRLSAFEQTMTTELDGLKKTMTEADLSVMENLGDDMPIEKKVMIARSLTDKQRVPVQPGERPGATPPNADAILKEYHDPATPGSRKYEILDELEKSYPEVYATI